MFMIHESLNSPRTMKVLLVLSHTQTLVLLINLISWLPSIHHSTHFLFFVCIQSMSVHLSVYLTSCHHFTTYSCLPWSTDAHLIHSLHQASKVRSWKRSSDPSWLIGLIGKLGVMNFTVWVWIGSLIIGSSLFGCLNPITDRSIPFELNTFLLSSCYPSDWFSMWSMLNFGSWDFDES